MSRYSLSDMTVFLTVYANAAESPALRDKHLRPTST